MSAIAKVVKADVYDGTTDDVLQLSNCSDVTYRMNVLPYDKESSSYVTIWGKSSSDESRIGIKALGTTQIAVLNNKWQRLEIYIEEPSKDESSDYIDISPFSNDDLYFYKCMEENRTNKPSDWTAAPEDTEETTDLLAANIEELRNTFTVMNDGFQDVVTIVKGDGVEDTGSEGINKLFESIDSTTFNQVQSFFKFSVDTQGPDIGTPKLTMGTTLSEIKMVLTNKKLSFLLQGNEVAYFSDSKLYVTNVEAIERLSVGTPQRGYLDIITTDHGVGLMWRS